MKRESEYHSSSLATHTETKSMMRALIVLLLLLPPAVEALNFFEGCGSSDELPLTFAGSSTVQPLAEAWANGIESECPDMALLIEGGGSSVGARRVCNADDEDTSQLAAAALAAAVDIGGMSREWNTPSESSTEDGWNYDCAVKSPAEDNRSGRSVIQVEVAYDGISVAVAKGSIADQCIRVLGGLTKHQMRWMFSNMTLSQLVASGLPTDTVPQSDLNENTKYWNELMDHPACPKMEIHVSGPDDASGTYAFFRESILTSGDSETFASTYISSDSDEYLTEYLEQNTGAVSFFSAAYTKKSNSDKLSIIKIANQFGMYLEPTAENIFSGEYSPLSRTIYMNVHNNAKALQRAKPFFEYGFSEQGTVLVQEIGYVPLPDFKKIVMLTRLQANGGVRREGVKCGYGDFKIAGASGVYPISQIWAGVYSTLCGSNIEVEAGGSSVGAGRVCGSRLESPVEIGNMERDWFVPSEATTENAVNFDCTGSPRSATQVAVAYGGISLVTKPGGVADRCITSMGGLTIDQARWIYSHFNFQELSGSSWMQDALPNSDGKDETHLWSELHPDCPSVEIRIAGATDSDVSYDFVKGMVLVGGDTYNPEVIDEHRASGYFSSCREEDLAAYLDAHEEAIAYVGFPFLFENLDILSPVPIENKDGEFVNPSELTIEDGTYNPLSRPVYMNLLDDEKSLNKTRPFVEFGLSQEGMRLVSIAGSAPISSHESFVMHTRAGTALGINLDEVECGPPGEITIAGSSTVYPVAKMWAGIYQHACKQIKVKVEGGGSSDGAGRVCANLDRGSPVNVGDMSRQWKEGKEASADNEFPFVRNCLKGDQSRSAIQIDVAIDGLTAATYGGYAADACIRTMGGLTVDQLRWIYSSYSEEKLLATGWDSFSALKNSDNNPSTHLWSELDPRCEPEEILIAGADEDSGTFEYFLETVLTDHKNGETFGFERSVGYFKSEVDEDLIYYLSANKDAAITYLGFSYYYSHQNVLSAAPIQNKDGEFVSPTSETVGTGEYNPLARRIFMNVLNQRDALEDTVPFVKFGLGNDGSRLVAATGYVPIPDIDYAIMMNRLENSPYNEPEYEVLSDGAVAGIVIGGIVVILLIGLGLWWTNKYTVAHQDYKSEQTKKYSSGVAKAKASRDMVELLGSFEQMDEAEKTKIKKKRGKQ